MATTPPAPLPAALKLAEPGMVRCGLCGAPVRLPEAVAVGHVALGPLTLSVWLCPADAGLADAARSELLYQLADAAAGAVAGDPAETIRH